MVCGDLVDECELVGIRGHLRCECGEADAEKDQDLFANGPILKGQNRMAKDAYFGQLIPGDLPDRRLVVESGQFHCRLSSNSPNYYPYLYSRQHGTVFLQVLVWT